MLFKRRVIEPEVLDHLPPEAARPNLADLVRINRNFGGHSSLRKLMARVACPTDTFTVLDIGAASGDSAAVIKEQYAGAQVVSLDLNWTNLERAPQPKLIADAFALPFAETCFDYVYCSLFLHHFTDEMVLELLRGFHTLATRAVLIADLERHVLPYLFLPATKWLFGWNNVTVADGVKSVRASFRLRELTRLAAQLPLAEVEAHTFRPAFRIGLVIRKQQVAFGPVGTRR